MQNTGVNSAEVSPRSAEASSIKDYIMVLKQQLADAYGQLKEYKKASEEYRGEIEQMRHVLEAVNQDQMSHVVPKLQLTSDTYNKALNA